MLCATVVDIIPIDEWGILNVLCLMLPTMAPSDDSFAVVMPQTRASIYLSSVAVRTAVFGIVSKQADWSAAINPIANENRATPHRS